MKNKLVASAVLIMLVLVVSVNLSYAVGEEIQQQRQVMPAGMPYQGIQAAAAAQQRHIDVMNAAEQSISRTAQAAPGTNSAAPTAGAQTTAVNNAVAAQVAAANNAAAPAAGAQSNPTYHDIIIPPIVIPPTIITPMPIPIPMINIILPNVDGFWTILVGDNTLITFPVPLVIDIPHIMHIYITPPPPPLVPPPPLPPDPNLIPII